MTKRNRWCLQISHLQLLQTCWHSIRNRHLPHLYKFLQVELRKNIKCLRHSPKHRRPTMDENWPRRGQLKPSPNPPTPKNKNTQWCRHTVNWTWLNWAEIFQVFLFQFNFAWNFLPVQLASETESYFRGAWGQTGLTKSNLLLRLRFCFGWGGGELTVLKSSQVLFPSRFCLNFIFKSNLL